MRFVFPYEYNTSEPDTATASRRPAHPVSGCGGDHHHHHHHQQYRRSQYENRRMTGKKCVQLRTSSSSSCANNSVVTCAVTSNPATNTTMALSIGSKLPLQSADKNRHRPRRKRGWLYRTFIGDDTQEVEDKSDTKTNCVQSTATTATTPTTTTKPPNLSLAPPLRQPAQYESARQNLTPSAVPDYEWPSNEILYRCVYPPPCRVVTDSTPVITPPLSLQRYRSAYSVSPHIPSYCAGMAVSTTASGPDNV